jgi:predicted membrane channel-forming protein YqfA (hemolysin III family)
VIGQLLIWYNKPEDPKEKIDCFQNFLQSGYLHMIFGVAVFPRLSQLTLIRNPRSALGAWVQLSCVFISLFSLFQATFIKDSAFHLRMTIGFLIYIACHLYYFAQQRSNSNGVQQQHPILHQMQVLNHQNMNNRNNARRR